MNVDKYVVEKAAEHAAALLSPLGKRWRHVQGVVQRAYSVLSMTSDMHHHSTRQHFTLSMEQTM